MPNCEFDSRLTGREEPCSRCNSCLHHLPKRKDFMSNPFSVTENASGTFTIGKSSTLHRGYRFIQARGYDELLILARTINRAVARASVTPTKVLDVEVSTK